MTYNSKVIEVVPYDPNWPKTFEEEALKIKKSLAINFINIHHIGSTSVSGLSGKPKIDIIAVVKFPADSILQLTRVGYTYKGEWNIPFKYGFTKRGIHNINLHVYEDNHPEIELNLLFRDYLRHHMEARDEYALLKEKLLKDPDASKKINSTFSGYNLGKNDFIQGIIKKTNFNRIRMLQCTHYSEWQSIKKLKNRLDPSHTLLDISQDPQYTYLVLYQGVEIIGYAHIQRDSDTQITMHTLLIDSHKQNQGFDKHFISLIEKWLQQQGYKNLYVMVSEAFFYLQQGYIRILPHMFDNITTNSQTFPMGKPLINPKKCRIKFIQLSDIKPSDIISLMNHSLLLKHMPLATHNFNQSDYNKFIHTKEKMWNEYGYGAWAFLLNKQFIGWGGLQAINDEIEIALVLSPIPLMNQSADSKT